MGDGYLPLERAGIHPPTDKRLSGLEKAMGGRAHLGMVDALPTTGARLRAVTRDLRDVHLPRHDSHHGQTLGVKFDRQELFKRPLKGFAIYLFFKSPLD